jgi:hypothetical protein
MMVLIRCVRFCLRSRNTLASEIRRGRAVAAPDKLGFHLAQAGGSWLCTGHGPKSVLLSLSAATRLRAATTEPAHGVTQGPLDPGDAPRTF